MTSPSRAVDQQTYDVLSIRGDFPILDQEVHGKPLVYLDNAATTQKPRVVIDAMEQYYTRDNSNIHRGVHELSNRATNLYESARSAVRDFLGAESDREIVFLRGATEAINLVADSFGRSFREGDEIVISTMEHHSNIVPWQLLSERTGAIIKVVPIDDDGQFMMDEYEKLLSDRTRLVGVVHQSNSLGTVNPVKEIIARAHAVGARVLVDGAQATSHQIVDVRDLDVDFYVLSGHKMYGPTGSGALYGKLELLEEMPPYQSGGDMILSVSFEKTVYNKVPHKFEAGTPHIAGPIGLKAAINYMQSVGMDRIKAHEQDVLQYGIEVLAEIPGLRMIGTAAERSSVLSFVMDGIHPHDIGTIIDREGIAIRTGHHCAQPVMARYGVPATARASLAMYNSRSDIDALARGLCRVIEVFS